MANEVKLKHKVQLRKKVEEAADEAQVESTKMVDTPDGEDTPKSKSWIWWIVAVLVIALLAFWFFSKPEAEQETIIGESTTQEQLDDQPADATEEIATEEVAAVEAVADEAETESVIETVTEQPAPAPQSIPSAQPEPAAASQSVPTSSSANVSDDVDAEALKVIRGDYGVGQERKDLLGAQYQKIQTRVNQILAED